MSPNLPAGPRAPTRQGERGFTLIEMTVSIIIMVQIVLASLMVLDFNQKLARAQSQITDMQQSLRVAQSEMVRLARMAGRGGLHSITPSRPTPKGAAVEVRNNVGGAVSDSLAIGYLNTPLVVDGTDVLTVRGVFSGQVWQLDSSIPATYTLFDVANNPTTDPTVAVRGVVQVCTTSPATPATSPPAQQIPQDLSPLNFAIANNIPEALVLVSAVDPNSYAVVELDAGASQALPASTSCAGVGRVGTQAAFKVIGDVNANAYQLLGSVTATNANPPVPTQNMPRLLNSASFLGVVEEYRYYVRQEYTVPGNAASDPAPRLSRARLYPGTELPYRADPANLSVDVADNILDLQVALGIDVNNDGTITDTGNAADEWLYNSTADDPLAAGWRNTVTNPPSVPATSTPPPPLFYVRISTLARTGRRDFNYQAPLVTQIEDHVYNQTPPVTSTTEANTYANRLFRRRLLQTVVGVRNL
jgi:prepilin-type N-terminal cleavage/methylation domain-containing protein